MRGSHLLPSQLPWEHTDHKAASRCSEPFLECTLFLHLLTLLVLILSTRRGMEGWFNLQPVESGVNGYWTWDLSHEGLLLYQLSYPSFGTWESPQKNYIFHMLTGQIPVLGSYVLMILISTIWSLFTCTSLSNNRHKIQIGLTGSVSFSNGLRNPQRPARGCHHYDITWEQFELWKLKQYACFYPKILLILW